MKGKRTKAHWSGAVGSEIKKCFICIKTHTRDEVMCRNNSYTQDLATNTMTVSLLTKPPALMYNRIVTSAGYKTTGGERNCFKKIFQVKGVVGNLNSLPTTLANGRDWGKKKKKFVSHFIRISTARSQLHRDGTAQFYMPTSLNLPLPQIMATSEPMD